MVCQNLATILWLKISLQARIDLDLISFHVSCSIFDANSSTFVVRHFNMLKLNYIYSSAAKA